MKKIALKESNLKESQLLQSLDKGLNTSKIIISPLMDKNIGFCFTVKKLSVHPEPVLSRLEGLSRRMKLGILIISALRQFAKLTAQGDRFTQRLCLHIYSTLWHYPRRSFHLYGITYKQLN
ncbi:MAG: hypothetical protein ACRENZ_04595 [Thermodesulfobacteriota bacterium]